MVTLYVFPDTNFLIHFKRPDQIDWRSLTGASEVVVVLTSVVIRELDDIKNRHESRKLKQRARDLSSWVGDCWANPEGALRTGATLAFHTRENEEHLTDGLSSRINDDRLIANALSFLADRKPVAIATNDTIAGIKAEQRGIRWIRPGDDVALPLEKDEIEKERDALKRQIETDRARAPRLEAHWHGEAHGARIYIRPLRAPASPTEVAQQLPPMWKPGEPLPARLAALSAVSSYSAVGVSASSIDHYNGALERYLKSYARYHAEAIEALDHNRRLVDLQLLLRNVGSASATYVAVRIKLPQTIEAIRNPGLRDLPDRPEPPEKPSPFGLGMPRSLTGAPIHLMRAGLFRPPRQMLPEAPNPLAPTLAEEGQIVTWNVERLLHGNEVALEPVRCLIARQLIGATGQIEVMLHADEQAAPQTVMRELAFVEVAA